MAGAPTRQLIVTGAFVLQFRAGSDFESGRIEGRIEHIASGETARFDSIAALLAILARLVKDPQV